MSTFTYGDAVIVRRDAAGHLRHGVLAYVVGIAKEEDRRGEYLARFPTGFVYTIEYDDGTDAQVAEHDLEIDTAPDPSET